jgi:hypothetical protein
MDFLHRFWIQVAVSFLYGGFRIEAAVPKNVRSEAVTTLVVNEHNDHPPKDANSPKDARTRSGVAAV